MKIFGLTGSIATGKSFVAEEFKKLGVKNFSSDRAVSQLLEEEEVVHLISKDEELKFSVINMAIDKHKLSKIVFSNHAALKKLEDILHPLIDQEEKIFL